MQKNSCQFDVCKARHHSLLHSAVPSKSFVANHPVENHCVLAKRCDFEFIDMHSVNKLTRPEDLTSMKITQECTWLLNGYLVVPVLWKRNIDTRPGNFGLIKKRLKVTIHEMMMSARLMERYLPVKIVEDFIHPTLISIEFNRHVPCPLSLPVHTQNVGLQLASELSSISKEAWKVYADLFDAYFSFIVSKCKSRSTIESYKIHRKFVF